MSEKFDDEKIDMSLLQFLHNALTHVALVMDYGQTKYKRGGFLDVPDGHRRYTAAMLRHLMAEPAGIIDEGDPFYDTEEGARFKGKLRHDAQVAVNALFRLELKLREAEENEKLLDDFISQFYEDRRS